MSVITRIGDATPDDLAACLRAAESQRMRRGHGSIEHVVVGSSQDHQGVELLNDAAARSSIVLVDHGEPSSVSAALNAAIDRASGEFVMFVGDDDSLATEAVVCLLDAAARTGRSGGQERSGRESGGPTDGPVDVVYADHDHVGAVLRVGHGAPRTGGFVVPDLKPAWSPERLRTQNYIGAPVAVRRSLLLDVGGFRPSFDGAHEHDLLLRLGERARRIVHVPEVLLHRRVHDQPTSDRFAVDATQRAVADHCDRIGVDATVTSGIVMSSTDTIDEPTPTPEGGWQCAYSAVVPTIVEPEPLVSVVIPTNGSTGTVWGTDRCFVTEAVRTFVERSMHRSLEFVVVADSSTPAATIHALRDIAGERLTLVPFARPFNFSEKINAGVAAASGNLILMLNDDTELIEPASVSRLVSTVLQPAEGCDGRWGDVAMAGARLLFDDGTLQHGGVIVNGNAAHACQRWPGDTFGPAPSFPLAGARECSGVTAAVGLVRREIFDAVGGLDPALPLNFNDVDFCSKIRAAGHRIIYRPDASWYHFESRTRQALVLDRETEFMNEHWYTELRNDPYYHPALIDEQFDWRHAEIDIEPPERASGVFTDTVVRNLDAVRARVRASVGARLMSMRRPPRGR